MAAAKPHAHQMRAGSVCRVATPTVAPECQDTAASETTGTDSMGAPWEEHL